MIDPPQVIPDPESSACPMPGKPSRIFCVKYHDPLKFGDMRLFASLSAACRGFIHTKAGRAEAVRGKATTCLHAGGDPQAWRHHARFFRPSFGFGRVLGGPAATPWVDGR